MQGEELITIDELRTGMPDLRARETNLRNQIQALDSQLADREAYLKLASDLEGFLAQLHTKAETSTVQQRRRVQRLLVKDILIGPQKITIRHRIPIRDRASNTPRPTRRANIAKCVGGVLADSCGFRDRVAPECRPAVAAAQ
jgi:site-specific DNA recombinase